MSFVPPWHVLGAYDIKDADVETILKESGGDYEVLLSPVMVQHPETGDTQRVEDRFVTGRLLENGQMKNWDVVKGRYRVLANDVIIRKAVAIVKGLVEGQAYLDCAGVLDMGRKFFVTVSTGESALEEDKVSHFVSVITSHDGSLPIAYDCLDVRQKTGSVYRLRDTDRFSSSLRKRHTPSSRNDSEETSEILGRRILWNDYFCCTADRFISQTVSDRGFGLAMNFMWPKEKADSVRKEMNRDIAIQAVRDLFSSSHNTGLYGKSYWSLFNALNEYIDTERKVSSVEAAQQALEVDNVVHRMKLKAFDAVDWLCGLAESE